MTRNHQYRNRGGFGKFFGKTSDEHIVHPAPSVRAHYYVVSLFFFGII